MAEHSAAPDTYVWCFILFVSSLFCFVYTTERPSPYKCEYISFWGNLFPKYMNTRKNQKH